MLDLKDSSTFKQHLRDFLVQSKSFVDKDNQELFAEEAAARQAVSPRFFS
jgi:exportin-1